MRSRSSARATPTARVPLRRERGTRRSASARAGRLSHLLSLEAAHTKPDLANQYSFEKRGSVAPGSESECISAEPSADAIKFRSGHESVTRSGETCAGSTHIIQRVHLAASRGRSVPLFIRVYPPGTPRRASPASRVARNVCVRVPATLDPGASYNRDRGRPHTAAASSPGPRQRASAESGENSQRSTENSRPARSRMHRWIRSR